MNLRSRFRYRSSAAGSKKLMILFNCVSLLRASHADEECHTVSESKRFSVSSHRGESALTRNTLRDPRNNKSALYGIAGRPSIPAADGEVSAACEASAGSTGRCFAMFETIFEIINGRKEKSMEGSTSEVI
jgi:hypothetical protein